MKDPSSFNVSEINVILDTVPLYLNHEVLRFSGLYAKAQEEYDRYKNRSDLWQKEKDEAYRGLDYYKFRMPIFISEQKKTKQPVQYIVLMNCSGKNSYGGIVSSKYILIVDKDNTDKVLGEYILDSEFAKKIITAYIFSTGGEKLKENNYGKIDTDNMSQIEKFLFGDL